MVKNAGWECLNKHKGEGADGGETKNSVASSVNALDSELSGSVPKQVSEAVPEVEGEGGSGSSLDTELSDEGKTAKGSSKRSSINLVAENGEDGVGKSVAVEGEAQKETADSVEG